MAHRWSSLQLITYNVTYIIVDFTPKISGRNHMLNSKNKSLPLLLNEQTSVWHKLTYQYFFQQHIFENVSEKFDLNRTRPFANITIKIYLTKNNAMSYLYFFRWIGYILIENTSFTPLLRNFLSNISCNILANSDMWSICHEGKTKAGDNTMRWKADLVYLSTHYCHHCTVTGQCELIMHKGWLAWWSY